MNECLQTAQTSLILKIFPVRFILDSPEIKKFRFFFFHEDDVNLFSKWFSRKVSSTNQAEKFGQFLLVNVWTEGKLCKKIPYLFSPLILLWQFLLIWFLVFNVSETNPSKTKRRFWAKFCLFSSDGTPSAVFLPKCLWNLSISAYLKLKWYPILVINLSMVPICHFSAYAPLIFHLFFCLTFHPFTVGPVLLG